MTLDLTEEADMGDPMAYINHFHIDNKQSLVADNLETHSPYSDVEETPRIDDVPMKLKQRKVHKREEKLNNEEDEQIEEHSSAVFNFDNDEESKPSPIRRNSHESHGSIKSVKRPGSAESANGRQNNDSSSRRDSERSYVTQSANRRPPSVESANQRRPPSVGSANRRPPSIESANRRPPSVVSANRRLPSVGSANSRPLSVGSHGSRIANKRSGSAGSRGQVQQVKGLPPVVKKRESLEKQKPNYLPKQNSVDSGGRVQKFSLANAGNYADTDIQDSRPYKPRKHLNRDDTQDDASTYSQKFTAPQHAHEITENKPDDGEHAHVEGNRHEESLVSLNIYIQVCLYALFICHFFMSCISVVDLIFS